MTVAVLGSINMDMVTRVAAVPRPGQTVAGESFAMTPGGKGANQAVAAARAGASVNFMGKVGGDLFASELISSLRTAGVNSDCVRVESKTSSGVAAITLTKDSQNSIIVIPGANAMLVVQDVDTLAEFFPFSTCLLLQLEIPMDVNIKAARLAHQAGVRVILDPAPATVLPDELLVNVDIITPNQSEAKTITGLDANTYKQTNDVIARLVDMGIRQPIIKMGQHGVCWYEDGKIKSMKAFNVDVIDTVAAGDAFNGGLAAALDEHKSLDSAIMFAQATAAISVTRYGAQQAMPIKNEINAFLATRDK